MAGPKSMKCVGPLVATGLTKTCSSCGDKGSIAVDKGAAEQPSLLVDWNAKRDPSVMTGARKSVEVGGDVCMTLAELLDAHLECGDCKAGKLDVFPARLGSEIDLDPHPNARLYGPLESAAKMLRRNDNRDGWLAEKAGGRIAPVLRALMKKCEPEYRERFIQCVTDPKFDPVQLSD